MNHKRCSKCNKLKQLSQFHKQMKGRLQRRPDCKVCRGIKFRKRLTLKQKKLYQKIWQKKNKKHLQIFRRKYASLKYKTDLQYRLKANLRQRMRKALKHGKSYSTIKALGRTVKELMQYLQTLFTEDMSWKNYGKWHVDHIRPLCSFDLLKKTEYIKACHYTNLQPLWAKDNFKKSTLDRRGKCKTMF